MLEVRESISLSGNNLMNGNVLVDVFVLGDITQGKVGRSYNRKKKKAVTVVQLTKYSKTKFPVSHTT